MAKLNSVKLAAGWMILVLAGGTVSALDWQPEGPHRRAALPAPQEGKPGFRLMPPSETGLNFTNILTEERGLTNQIFLSGSGVAAGDVDGDGWSDLFFCSIDGPNKLFRNLGQWKFQDVTDASGLTCVGQGCTGAVMADVDGDGDLDLLVTGIGHGVRLFLNDGQGHFSEATRVAGLASTSAAMTVSVADVDGDGALDLYVANYRPDTIQDEVGLRFLIGTTNGQAFIRKIDDQPVSEADRLRYSVDRNNTIVENGEASVLYHNDGHGHFTPVSWTDGSFLDEDGQRLKAAPLDWTYTAQFRDLNGDGAPDLYVCNDSESPDRIWLNDGHGRFRALPRLAVRETAFSSMSVDFADLNRDGFDEFFVSDMISRDHRMRHTLMAGRHAQPKPGQVDNRPAYARNMLFLNRGDGTYAEIAQLAGVDATDWTWSPIFLDVDLDGYEDLLITTGLERSLRNADARMKLARAKAQKRLTKREFLELRRQLMPRLEQQNWAFRNRGDLTFAEVSQAWGFDARQVSQGMVAADLDNDGDLDVIINSMNGPALVYRNNASAPRVAVRLKGSQPNTRGIGAKIRVNGGPVPQSQEMICGGHYLSGDDAVRVFAAGSLSNHLAISVTWRKGGQTVLTNVRPNCIYEIAEVDTNPRRSATPPEAPGNPLFREVSSHLRHQHVETEFNDFERQPLLPRRLSPSGPGVCWTDLNGDGWEDLLIGGTRGGEWAVFLNNGKGGFTRSNILSRPEALPGDATTILSIQGDFPSALVLVGQSNYRTGSAEDPAVLSFICSSNKATAGPTLAPWGASVGPMAFTDLRGDGHLTLFVGGRVVPGRYPEPAASRLFRFENGQFTPEAEANGLLEQAGLVSGAVFSDLDGDGWPDLVLACEWGPIRIFRNDHGKLTRWDWKVTMPLAPRPSPLAPLSDLTGWWNSVAVGDFDGDGRLDIVAGNWGRNSRYQFYLDHPLHLYYGDFNGAGQVEMLDAHYEAALGKDVPWRYWDTLAKAMPFIQARFPSFTAYSGASVEDLLQDRLAKGTVLSATTLDSVVLLNRGDHFEVHPLPLEAQWAPVFGLNVADFDGDGHEDLFLAQNFFAVDNETSRYDAGRGLVLKGDGRGGFAAMPGPASGVLLYGEQRGSAACDYDHDGRVDLLVGQNAAATALLHNETGRPGLRVRLEGPPGNPAGLGAVLRLEFATNVRRPSVAGPDGFMGPAREIHAGSGYCSQDSFTQVLATPATPTHLHIRWPGGTTTRARIVGGAREIEVDPAGNLRTVPGAAAAPF